MTINKVNTVFFDLDGTLVDSIPDLAYAVDASLKEMNLPQAGLDRVRLWVGQGAKKLVDQALSFATAESVNNIEQQLSQQALELFLKHYKGSAQHSVLYPNVIATLDQLQANGYRLVLITNKPTQFLPDLLEHLAIADYFELILGGDSLSQSKPHPMPLLHAMKAFNLQAEQCVMVGDSGNDIYAAKAAAIASVCVTYGYNHGVSPTELPATWFIDDIAQLLTILPAKQ